MVDTVKNRTDLKVRAAKSLAIIEPGETLSTEDDETLDDLVDPLIAQLAQDGIIYIDDADEIDVAYFIPLARLLANMAGPDFGSPINEGAKLRDEMILRRMASTKPTYEVLKTTDF